MNAFWIKVIAIGAMLVDHFALIFFPESLTFQIIGRLSYPLIAWLIANGALHTHDIDAYLKRLFLFALLAQIPYEIGFYLSGAHPLFLNVLFTLCFGLLAIRTFSMRIPIAMKFLFALCCILASGFLHADYGAGGVISILAFYVFFNRPFAMVLSQIFILAVLTNLSFFIGPYFGTALVMHPLEKYATFALPILLLYNGKRGLATGTFFYWFFIAQNFAVLFLKMALR